MTTNVQWLIDSGSKNTNKSAENVWDEISIAEALPDYNPAEEVRANAPFVDLYDAY